MPQSGKLILLVEDDPGIRVLLETAARRCGRFSEVRSADDGQAALELLRDCETDNLPELIVTDLSMPRLSGLDLLAAIKRDDRTRRIPVAILTSSDVPYDRERALAAGACSFVPKPLGLDALGRALASIADTCEATA